MKILFAGGGTGGHLSPGIALAEELTGSDPSSEILFAVTGREAEEVFFDDRDFRREVVNAPRSGGTIFSRLAFPFRLVRAIGKCKRLIRDFSPDAVVGLGGYASAPVVFAAHSRAIPSALIEQNAVPGRATRFLAPRAAEIYCQFPCTVETLESRGRPFLTGTPVRAEILDADTFAASRTLTLAPRRRTILIIGGSQGARGVNDIVTAILPRLARDYGLLQVVHQTGNADYDRVRSEYARYHIEARVFRFIKPVGAALRSADIVICRAGATGIAEITALGLPSILLPYPHSLDGEQRANAAQLVERGAAYVVDELSPGARDELYAALSKLLDDRDKARQVGENAASMGYPQASKTIADRIIAIAGKARSPAAKVAITSNVGDCH